jgi:uncharacterized membrane protein YhaH (DUF805 family)
MRVVMPHVSIDPARFSALLARLSGLLLAFDGRIGRRAFWAGSLGVALALLLFERVLAKALPQHAPLAMVIASAAALYPFAALATKRGRERGHGEHWGVGLVLLTLATGLTAQALAGGAWALQASLASLGLWMFTLIDLGLCPAAQERPLPRAVGAAGKR